MTEVVEEHR